MQPGGLPDQREHRAAVYRLRACHREGEGVRLPGEAQAERGVPAAGGAQKQGQGELEQPGFKRGEDRLCRQVQRERDPLERQQYRSGLGRGAQIRGRVCPEQRPLVTRELQHAAHLQCAHAGEHLPGALPFGLALLPERFLMKKIVGERLAAFALRIQGGEVRVAVGDHIGIPHKKWIWRAAAVRCRRPEATL